MVRAAGRRGARPRGRGRARPRLADRRSPHARPRGAGLPRGPLPPARLRRVGRQLVRRPSHAGIQPALPGARQRDRAARRRGALRARLDGPVRLAGRRRVRPRGALGRGRLRARRRRRHLAGAARLRPRRGARARRGAGAPARAPVPRGRARRARCGGEPGGRAAARPRRRHRGDRPALAAGAPRPGRARRRRGPAAGAVVPGRRLRAVPGPLLRGDGGRDRRVRGRAPRRGAVAARGRRRLPGGLPSVPARPLADRLEHRALWRASRRAAAAVRAAARPSGGREAGRDRPRRRARARGDRNLGPVGPGARNGRGGRNPRDQRRLLPPAGALPGRARRASGPDRGAAHALALGGGDAGATGGARARMGEAARQPLQRRAARRRPGRALLPGMARPRGGLLRRAARRPA